MTAHDFPNLPFDQMAPIFNAFCEGVLVIDEQGVVVAVNMAAQALYHNGEPLAPGMLFAEYAPQDWVEVKRVMASGQAQTGRYLVLPQAEVLINRIPLMADGEVVGVIMTLQDVGACEAAVAHLPGYRRLSDTFEALIEQSGDALIMVDVAGHVSGVNTTFERLMAQGRQAIMGRHYTRLRRLPSQVGKLLGEVLTTGTRAHGYEPLKDGPSLLIGVSPAFDGRGELFMVVCRLYNLTAFSRLQERFLPPQEAPVPAVALAPDKEREQVRELCAAHGIVVHSEAMHRVVCQAIKVSQTESSVLLQGESGVGKSLLASLIHAHSPRREQPFVVINCGAIPEALMESELFGYERGAFTGATSQGKLGLFEAAARGTLFLDEVGELSLPMQVKLLEAIESKSFLRVGGTKRVAVDVRIVAATNKQLEKEVADGAFRKDLYYRLNVIPLCIPPLSERREDIVAMAENILVQRNARHGTTKRLSPQVMQWFMQYGFPGNARELVNVLEWMLVMGEGDILTLGDLPTGLRARAPEPAEPRNRHVFADSPFPETRTSPGAVPDFAPENRSLTANPAEGGPCIRLPQAALPLKDAMNLMECAYLRHVIASQPSLQEAARVLDIHFSTLWRKMTQYQIRQDKPQ